MLYNYLFNKGLWVCFLLCILFYVQPSYAQYENIWIFGKAAGLDFNGASVTPIVSNSNIAIPAAPLEACASVCSSSGALLFYTEGTVVRNRQHNIMPNGNNLLPINGIGSSLSSPFTATSSASQGTLIVPMPGSAYQYYVFSLTAFEEASANNWGRLYYSVVDMSLDGGYGNVVTGQMGIPVDSNLSERMTTVAGNCNNIWLLTVSRNNEVKAFEITAAGINPNPVISPVANFDPVNNPAGCISVAPNRSRVAITQYGGALTPALNINGLALFDFDPGSGTLSNQQELSPSERGYGVCFSPDNTKLYFLQWYNNVLASNGVYQFNLSAGSPANIVASKTFLTGSLFSQLKLGPNGKIYFRGTDLIYDRRLSVIHLPDMPGTACMPQADALSLLPGTRMDVGLPNVVTAALPLDTVFTISNQVACATQTVVAANDTTGSGYRWNDGLTRPSRVITQAGKCWVTYKANCTYHVDTFNVTLLRPSQYSFTQVSCPNEQVVFNGIVRNATGKYREIFPAANGCDSVVTLDLIVLPGQDITLTKGPGGLCIGDSVFLEAEGAAQYRWYNNDRPAGEGAAQNIYLPYTANHVVLVAISDNDCRDTLRTTIPAGACCAMFVPNAFSPNGDGLNETFGPESTGNFYSYHLFIYNRWGEKIYQAFNFNDQWDGTWKGKPLETGTYFYQIKANCLDGAEVYRKGDISLIR